MKIFKHFYKNALMYTYAYVHTWAHPVCVFPKKHVIDRQCTITGSVGCQDIHECPAHSVFATSNAHS